MASFEEKKAALPEHTRKILEGWTLHEQRQWVANPLMMNILHSTVRKWLAERNAAPPVPTIPNGGGCDGTCVFTKDNSDSDVPIIDIFADPPDDDDDDLPIDIFGDE